MADPNDLAAILADAWQHLTRGVADRHAPARHPTLATVSPEGRPEARSVVLRAASRSEARLEIHTDSTTAKVAALQANPEAALHIWVPKAHLQIRAMAQVTLRSGPAVAAQWEKVPPRARVSYGTEPAPGSPIASAEAYSTPGTDARFMVLHCQVTELDLLHLGQPHRRAQFTAADAWRGTWVAP